MQIIQLKEAKNLGLKNYFTGLPCKHGHVSERYTSTRQCCECVKQHSDKWKSIPENAQKRRISSLKRYAENPERRREHARNYYWNNRDLCLEKSTRWKKENKEKVRSTLKEYRDKNRDHVKAIVNKWRAKNKDSVNANARDWRQKNIQHARKRSRDYQKEKYKSDPMYRASVAMRKWLRRSLDQSNLNLGHEEKIGYSGQELVRHIEGQFEDGMSWSNHGEWHIDHITPVAHYLRAGVTDPRIINRLSNLRPLWAKDNLERRRVPSRQDIDRIKKMIQEDRI